MSQNSTRSGQGTPFVRMGGCLLGHMQSDRDHRFVRSLKLMPAYFITELRCCTERIDCCGGREHAQVESPCRCSCNACTFQSFKCYIELCHVVHFVNGFQSWALPSKGCTLQCNKGFLCCTATSTMLHQYSTLLPPSLTGEDYPTLAWPSPARILCVLDDKCNVVSYTLFARDNGSVQS